ncbi:MAG: Uncharacterized protein Athens071426_106 [Parcubacteria group bacterium Athens0714_26]|nr:MAG: Uncharacterized protein Athens071426_106 [Parcubacteria group bacterium Athens0714_26]
MAKQEEKQTAIELRKQGKSYSQIKQALKVSKSTLSNWLKNFPLAPKQLEKLMGKNEKRIENYIKTCRKRKENLLKQIYDEEKNVIFPLSKRDIFIAGLFLYWGEGGKTKEVFYFLVRKMFQYK